MHVHATEIHRSILEMKYIFKINVLRYFTNENGGCVFLLRNILDRRTKLSDLLFKGVTITRLELCRVNKLST